MSETVAPVQPRKGWRKILRFRYLLMLLALFGIWRAFLLVCPTRDLQVLKWTFETPTAVNWNEPYIPALVAENARLNGGQVGAYVGAILYAKSLIPSEARIHAGNAWAAPELKAKEGWIFRGALAPLRWSVQPVPGQEDQRYVDITGEIRHSVSVSSGWYPDGVVWYTQRYLVTDTDQGWRVISVSSIKDMGAPFKGEVPQHAPGS